MHNKRTSPAAFAHLVARLLTITHSKCAESRNEKRQQHAMRRRETKLPCQTQPTAEAFLTEAFSSNVTHIATPLRQRKRFQLQREELLAHCTDLISEGNIMLHLAIRKTLSTYLEVLVSRHTTKHITYYLKMTRYFSVLQHGDSSAEELPLPLHPGLEHPDPYWKTWIDYNFVFSDKLSATSCR